jgi:hypothetical protein
MKLSLYERLLQKEWFYRLMCNFTIMEYLVMFAVVIVFIAIL